MLESNLPEIYFGTRKSMHQPEMPPQQWPLRSHGLRLGNHWEVRTGVCNPTTQSAVLQLSRTPGLSVCQTPTPNIPDEIQPPGASGLHNGIMGSQEQKGPPISEKTVWTIMWNYPRQTRILTSPKRAPISQKSWKDLGRKAISR